MTCCSTNTDDHFVLEFGKERSAASEAIFNAKLAEVHAHNGKGATWTMGVNQFTDMTETEFAKYVPFGMALLPGFC